MFWIAPRMAIGRFALEALGPDLRIAGITHVLNVSDAPSRLVAERDRFAAVVHHPIDDLAPIPEEDALACLDALDGMLADPSARVYLHCMAGQRRAPTIAWLYLIARGMTARDARLWIESRAPDAVAGDPRMVRPALLERVAEHGRASYHPLGPAGPATI